MLTSSVVEQLLLEPFSFMEELVLMKKYVIILVISLWSFSAFTLADNKVASAAYEQIGKTLIYDPSYVKLAYPMGDVPVSRGVCSDVVIRALRASKVDLQQLVHEDMKKNFSTYPKSWGLTKTDINIDHRRVPNLETFLKRQNKSLELTTNPLNYKAGDIVSWRLDNGLPHIGIVSMNNNSDGTRPLIIHNIGWGTQEEDVLFKWKMIGHYRYFK